VKPGDLVKLSDPGVLPPLADKKGQLEYPAIARTRHIEGVVGISALVDEKGNVADAKVVAEVGGRAGLNEAALDYVKKWKFRPATLNGVPVKVWTTVNVSFKLQ
jgi:protein TonB